MIVPRSLFAHSDSAARDLDANGMRSDTRVSICHVKSSKLNYSLPYLHFKTFLAAHTCAFHATGDSASRPTDKATMRLCSKILLALELITVIECMIAARVACMCAG